MDEHPTLAWLNDQDGEGDGDSDRSSARLATGDELAEAAATLAAEREQAEADDRAVAAGLPYAPMAAAELADLSAEAGRQLSEPAAYRFLNRRRVAGSVADRLAWRETVADMGRVRQGDA